MRAKRKHEERGGLNHRGKVRFRQTGKVGAYRRKEPGQRRFVRSYPVRTEDGSYVYDYDTHRFAYYRPQTVHLKRGRRLARKPKDKK